MTEVSSYKVIWIMKTYAGLEGLQKKPTVPYIVLDELLIALVGYPKFVLI